MPGRQRTIRRPAAAADVTVLRRRLAEADARAEQCEAACAATRHELDVLREQSRQHTQQLLEAQVALEESHDRYVSLYDFAPVAFVSLDQGGIVRDLNLAAAQLLGADRSQVLHAPMLSYVHPASKRAFLDHMLRCRRGNVPAASELDLYPRAPADARPVLPAMVSTWFGVPRHGAGWEFRTALLDLTHQKRAEERERLYQQRLRSLASELSLAEERERRRIAVEIHDQISQSLAMAKMKLEQVGNKATAPPVKDAIREVSDLVGDVLGHTRLLTFELSPPVLHELGFEPAIEWLAERTQERYGLKVQVDVATASAGAAVPHDVSVLLFQAVRELLLNVAKHAHAKTAAVRLRRIADEGSLRVVVEDDGKGFDPQWQPSGAAQSDGSQGGFGLFSIRARLEHLGGSLEIESRPGRGARLTLTVPISEAAPDGGNGQHSSNREAYGGAGGGTAIERSEEGQGNRRVDDSFDSGHNAAPTLPPSPGRNRK